MILYKNHLPLHESSGNPALLNTLIANLKILPANQISNIADIVKGLKR